MEQTFRCGTKKAIDELSKELNIPHDYTMQDWTYTEGNAKDIDKHISHYEVETNDDKKFILMEFIIQATNDQETGELFLKYCDKIQQILQKDFKLHEYTIHYWACFDNDEIENRWRITPVMRKIWSENQNCSLSAQ